MGAFCMPSLKRPQDAAGGLEARRAVTPCHAPTTLHTRPLGASEAPQRPPPYNRASLNNSAREGRSPPRSALAVGPASPRLDWRQSPDDVRRRRPRPPGRASESHKTRPTFCTIRPGTTRRGRIDQNARLVRLGVRPLPRGLAAGLARPGWVRRWVFVRVGPARGTARPALGPPGACAPAGAHPALGPASGRMTRPTLGPRPEHRPRDQDISRAPILD